MKAIILLIIILSILVLTGCSDSTMPSTSVDEPESRTEIQLAEKEDESFLPTISEEAIKFAVNEILYNKDVVDAAVNVKEEEKSIVLAVQVNYLVNEEKAKELGESFARLLATFAADSEKTRMPGMDLSNTIYDYYDLHVIVGTGPGLHERLAYGVKSSIGYNIAW